MSTTAAEKALDVEDASQLSMIAYEREAYGRIADRTAALQRLRSPHALQIGKVILDPTSRNVPAQIRRAAEYFIEWARNTAQRSVELSRRIEKI